MLVAAIILIDPPSLIARHARHGRRFSASLPLAGHLAQLRWERRFVPVVDDTAPSSLRSLLSCHAEEVLAAQYERQCVLAGLQAQSEFRVLPEKNLAM